MAADPTSITEDTPEALIPLLALCDLLQQELGLKDDQVYLWNQKIKPIKDDRLYIAVGVIDDVYYGSTSRMDATGSGMVAKQAVAVQSLVSLDLCSRTSEARDRRHEVILALNSIRAQQLSEKYALRLGKLPKSFNNISEVDGGAIPYRFNASLALLYKVSKAPSVPYFDQFADPEIDVQSP